MLTEQIKASMLAFGFANPLLVDEDGMLIAGHGRLEAAAALGMAKVPVIVLRHFSAAQKEALCLADNRVAENATWDQALLRDALASMQAAEIDLAALGFSTDELAAILAAADAAVIDGDPPQDADQPIVAQDATAEPDDDAAADDPAGAEPEPPRQAVTRPSYLWLLGEHRLLRGDSTDAATVARVISDLLVRQAERPNQVWFWDITKLRGAPNGPTSTSRSSSTSSAAAWSAGASPISKVPPSSSRC